MAGLSSEGGIGAGNGGSGATSWRAHDGVILALDWCPISGRIASGGEDGRFKLWDSLGRSLAVGPVEEHVITSIAWAPRGKYFAVGSHGLLLLCDAWGNVRVREGLRGEGRGGGGGRGMKSSSTSLLGSGISVAPSPSLPSPTLRGAASLGSGGSGVGSLSWSPDGSILAAGTGSGALVLASVCGHREVSPLGYEASLVEPHRVSFTGAWSEASASANSSSSSAMTDAAAEFRERVCELSVGYGHAIVTTATQIHVFSASAGLGAPVCTLDTPRSPAGLIVQSSRGFLAVDTMGGFSIFTYDGRPVPGAPKLPEGTLRFLLSSRSTIALAPDAVAFLEGSERRGAATRAVEINKKAWHH